MIDFDVKKAEDKSFTMRFEIDLSSSIVIEKVNLVTIKMLFGKMMVGRIEPFKVDLLVGRYVTVGSIEWRDENELIIVCGSMIAKIAFWHSDILYLTELLRQAIGGL